MHTKLRAEFENFEHNPKYKDPLDYTFAETLVPGFDHEAIKYLRHKTSSSNNIKNIAVLRQRIFEHIHIYSFSQSCMSLRYLNQKFGLIANKLKINVHDIINDLIYMNKVKTIEANQSQGYFSISVWNDVLVEREKDPNGLDDFQYRKLLMDNMQGRISD